MQQYDIVQMTDNHLFVVSTVIESLESTSDNRKQVIVVLI